MRLKTVRIKLKTGEFFLKRNVIEFFLGKFFFVWVLSDNVTETFNASDISSVEHLLRGEYVKVSPLPKSRGTV